ncbi:MAG: gamma-glutamylcyclotransferase [Planctomycetales bacterium]|nr:gamma-glutamylcyclotransferase [Planctomycetales bacterium]
MSVSESEVACVFVYGTLKRGQCRESAWPVRPLDVIDGWVLGNLWGRRDYPALLAGENRVQGQLWMFETSQIADVLVVLDEIEETDGNAPTDLYHRHLIEVNLQGGQGVRKAHAYFYNRDPVVDGFKQVPQVGQYQKWP